MKTITSFLSLFTVFLLCSSGIIFIMTDISLKNDNLNNESLEMVTDLDSYSTFEQQYRFEQAEANYSLTGYETVDAEDKENAESKGIVSVFLFMGDAFVIIPVLMHTVIPFIPWYAFAWVEAILLAVAGYYFTLAIFNVWKAKRT